MKCSAFWKHTNIRPGNRVYPCCRFKYPVASFAGDLEKVLDSEEYQKLRAQSLAGKYIEGCEKCFYEEKIGHKSLRQEFNEKYSFNSVGLEYLEIGLDNLCNLVCDGCNSEFSTSWISKEKLIYGEPKNKYLDIEEITVVPESIKKILFLGGEPLITNKHLDLLRKHADPKTCDVIYNTNASFIPDKKCIEVWNHYRSLHFIISIDGVGEVHETVRGNSKWTDVLAFIDFCIRNNFSFEFNTVLHFNNLFDIENLVKFVANYSVDWYINVLTHPENLCINKHSRGHLEKFLSTIEALDFPNKQFIKNFAEDSLQRNIP